MKQIMVWFPLVLFEGGRKKKTLTQKNKIQRRKTEKSLRKLLSTTDEFD